MIGLHSNKVIKQKERGCPMATKLYTIENLLVGKTYRSRSRHFEGEIVSATPRPAIWYGENTEAYLIEVNARGLRNKFATIAVKVGE
jgi:hypothetical protein